MQGESSHAIGPGYDGNSGIVERFRHFQHLLERVAIALVHAVGHLKTAIKELPPNLSGHAIRYRSVARGNGSRAIGAHAFEDRQGRIEHRLVLLQKADEVLDPLRCGIDLGGVRGDFGESQTTACVFNGIEHEIQENEIHVLDFVRAIFDELLCRHERRDVPAHAHAMVMSHLGYLGDKLGLDGAVDFHLHVAKLGVAVDVVFGFLFGICENLGGSLIGTAAIYEPGFQHPGSDLRTIVEAALHGVQFVDVVSHIAHAGDAGSHVHQPIVGLQVNMHVPEARHEGLVGGVDYFRTLRSPDFLVIADSGDFVAGNYNRAVGMKGRALGVEKVRVHEDQRSGRFMTQLSCQIRGPLVRDPILRLQKCVDGGFPAFTNDREPRRYGREKRAVLVQPDGSGREIQTRDGVLRQVRELPLASIFNSPRFSIEASPAGKSGSWPPAESNARASSAPSSGAPEMLT
jgi:hypothetical protein